MWENFVNWLNNAWNWLNAPLPVVGVSVIFIGLFVWRIIASTSFGKRNIRKINEKFDRVKAENDAARVEREKFEENLISLLADKDKEIEKLKSIIKEICDAMPNKKVKAIGEKVYGKEETNGSTETKEI